MEQDTKISNKKRSRKNTRKNVLLSLGFNRKKEYKLYRRVGKSSYVKEYGEYRCNNYVAWKRHIEKFYKGLSNNDKLQFQWSVRDALKYASSDTKVIVSVFLTILILAITPYTKYAAAKIVFDSEAEKSNETVTVYVSEDSESESAELSKADQDNTDSKELAKLGIEAYYRDNGE